MTRNVLPAACVIAVSLGVALLPGGPVAQAFRPAGAGQAAAANADQRERAYRANNTGVAYLEQFNYPEAEREFREALKIQPDLAIARLNLGIAVLYQGRAADAAVEAREAVKRLDDLPQSHFVLGLAAKADDKADEAIEAFGRVLKLDAGDAATKVHLGQIYLQQRRYADALPLFQQAIAAEPYNVTAAYNVALALTRAGKVDEGRAAMQKFETLRDSPYGVTFAQTYLAQGRYGEAVASTGEEAELVDQAVPDVTFVDVSLKALPSAARGRVRALTLFDADGDGDLDLLETGQESQFLRNQAGVLSDDTARSGLGRNDAEWAGAIAGDYDNDTKTDLLLLGQAGYRLMHQKADGAFEDATAKAGFPAPPRGLASGAFVDVDHDGDLDILTAGDSLQLLRNNGDLTFTDIATASGLNAAANSLRVAATDYDNRRDIDLLVMGTSGLSLFRNMRDGSFRDWSKEAGLTSAGNPRSLAVALAVADINKDGYPDFLYSSADAAGGLALSDGQGRFRLAPAPAGTGQAIAYRLFDYDNDGLLDIIAVNRTNIRLFRNAGSGRWMDVTTSAHLPAQNSDVEPPSGLADLAVGDLDGDGDSDLLLVHEGRLRYFRNDGGNENASLKVGLTARVSNRAGLGAKVEMRAGSLRQVLETSSSSPAVVPADLVFGLGPRKAADVVRVLWPSGILQAETELGTVGQRAADSGQRPPSPGPRTADRGQRTAIAITELDRKPSSCPYLFTWNGSRFEFITDFMGGGEMGGWQGPATWSQPDPDEYVRIRPDQLQPRNGRYELRMTNELEETLFVDRLQLVAIDHAKDVDVFPSEGLRSAPPAFALTSTRDARPPLGATDEHGHDVLDRLSALDRRYPDDFRVSPIRGYAEPHELTLDLGAGADAPVLLLTGWTDYAFSNDNVAASQAGKAMSPPSLQVKDRQGQWRTVIEEIGFPVGRPQTVVVNLAGKFLSSSRDVRIVTNMRIYWDQVLVAPAPDRRPVTVTRIDPASADLRWRGMSREITPDGREPYSYDYQQVSTLVPWKAMIGRYTREGDVRPLLTRTDDRFVVSRPGDEVALSFTALPPVPDGRSRTFLLFVHGYSKEMNPRSAVPDTVYPLPFRAMTGYPYGPNEHYPRTKPYRDYQDEFNTRQIMRSVPPIDVSAAGARK
jgi:tetratricopeptide (TPR) repeat protein